MNQPTITGSTDSNGLFTAKNPYNPNTEPASHKWQADKHPPLFCYNDNNDLVKGVEGLEVKPWYAVSAVKDQTPRLLTDQEMNNYHSFEEFKKHKCMLFTYKVYIAVQPTEKNKINKMERTLPYNVNIEDVLTEVLQYMDDRADVKDSDLGASPNEEMRLSQEIGQALYQLSLAKPKPTSGQSMNFDNDPPVL